MEEKLHFMQYAVIKAQGKQYMVSSGDTITLDRFSQDGKKLVFDEILLLVDGDNVVLGNPNVKGAKIEAKFIEDKLGEKIKVRKYKAKVRYRKNIGFRPKQTVVLIENINYKTMFSSKSPKKQGKAAPKG